jgi:hypothetical protein
MDKFASLTVQIGPFAGHAEGAFAMALLFGVFAVYVLGPAIAAELVRRLARRWE